MDEKKEDKTKMEITRRGFVKGVAACAATAAMPIITPGVIRKSFAAKRDRILIGAPSPITGSAAAFGEPSKWMAKRVMNEVNKNGGIYVKEAGKKLPIEIKVIDVQSSPSKAAEMAVSLIQRHEVDLMCAFHSPPHVDPVTSVCEQFGMPCIAMDSPLDSFIASGPHKWAFQAFWTVSDDILPLFTKMWEEIPTNKNVGILFVNDPGAVPWHKAFNDYLPKKGFNVIDKGLFSPGNADFNGYIQAWKKADVEILTGNLDPPDFMNCWRQCYQMDFKPKIATIGRAILFPSVLEAMGQKLGEGLSSEIWWSPYHPYKSSLTGYSPKELCDAWVAETGRTWTQPIGYEYAAYETAVDVLKRTQSLDRETLRQTIAATDLDTIVGHIKFNDQNYCNTPVVGGQWVPGEKFPWDLQITSNYRHSEIPVTGEMFPLPL